MELYQRNISLIKNKIPTVYHALTAEKNFPDKVEYIPREDNFVILGNNYRVHMHSKYDQEREVKFLLDKIQGSIDTIILFGFGNGRAIQEISTRFPELKHLIIVDPNPEPLLSFLQRWEISSIFKYFPDITFVINKTVKEAEHILEQVIPKNNRLTVLSHLTYQIIYPGYYDALWQKLRSIIRFTAINTVTTEAFRKKWAVNVWRNLRYTSVDIGSFSKILNGVPAILVSAGPSLNKNIHLLKQAKSRALMVAAGSAMTILNSHGIIPHFRIAIDPSNPNEKLFDKVDTAACPLIYSNRLFHGILPNYKAAKIHIAFRDDDFLENYILNRADVPSMSIQSGFSVANTAMDVLIKLGCSKIILVGQDLCYTGGKLHAKGAWDEQYETTRQTDEALDIFGNQVFTDKPFLSMKQLFETLIAGASEVHFTNATEGGLAIKGAPNKTLAEVIEQDLNVEYNFTDEITKIWHEQQETLIEKKRKIDAVVDDIQMSVDELIARNERILRKIMKVEQKVECGVHDKTMFNELTAVNTLVQKQAKNAFFTEVVHPTYLNKFLIRGDKLLANRKDSSQPDLAKEVEVVAANSVELQEYLLLTAELIKEYKASVS